MIKSVCGASGGVSGGATDIPSLGSALGLSAAQLAGSVPSGGGQMSGISDFSYGIPDGSAIVAAAYAQLQAQGYTIDPSTGQWLSPGVSPGDPGTYLGQLYASQGWVQSASGGWRQADVGPGGAYFPGGYNQPGNVNETLQQAGASMYANMNGYGGASQLTLGASQTAPLYVVVVNPGGVGTIASGAQYLGQTMLGGQVGSSYG